MSVQQAKEFLLRLVENEDASDQADNAYLEALVVVASRLGYTLTADEIREAIRHMSGLADLTDQELAEVAGYAFARPGLRADSLVGLGLPVFSPLRFLRQPPRRF